MLSVERKSSKERLLAGTVLPLVFGVGVAIGGAALAGGSAGQTAAAGKPASVASMRGMVASNPAAVRAPADTLPRQIAQGGGCKAKCGACGVKAKCGACGPCGAGGAVSTACVVPRLQAAAKCGAKAKCGACAAKCGACGAKAKSGACGAKVKCGAGAAKCGACGAKAKCGACGACGAAAAAELTDAEAEKAYDCLAPEMQAAYAKAGVAAVAEYDKWRRFNTGAYQSATHGSRYVSNYANEVGDQAYGKFEAVGSMPQGSVLAKDSFVAMPDGRLAVGPLFVMQKMGQGFSKASRDWRYTMIMPEGSVAGTTGGAGAGNVQFCYECHNAMGAETDSLVFMPDEYRKKQ